MQQAPTLEKSNYQQTSSAADYFVLLKPRVMSLVIFTALIGGYLAPGQIHPFLFFVSILSIAIGAGASGVYNMIYDRDIDRVMKRTHNRPIPAGRVSIEEAKALATILSIGSVTVLGLATNLFAASLLAFTIFFYAVIYTIWLKRNTPQNIVIGGAAGAFPPMIAWAAVTGSITLESFVLFAIIFFWTPPHFWALALFQSEDYVKARIPMMPLVAGIPETKTQILIYSVVLIVTSTLPYIIGLNGILYLLSATILGCIFLRKAWQVKTRSSDVYTRQLFWFSIYYLFLLFTAMFLDKIAGL